MDAVRRGFLDCDAGGISKLNDHDALEDSASALRRDIKAGNINVEGVRTGGDGFPEKVPAAHFKNAAPFLADAPDELMFNDYSSPYLEWRSLAESHPELMEGDRIVRRGQTIWMRLTVKRDNILNLCRSAEADEPLPVGNGMANIEESANKRRRTKAVKLSEYMAQEFAADPGKSVADWRRHFKLKNMNEYEASDQATISKACGIAWPPK